MYQRRLSGSSWAGKGRIHSKCSLTAAGAGKLTRKTKRHLVVSNCNLEGARLCNSCLAAGGGCSQPVDGLVAGQECLCSNVPGAKWHSWQSEVLTHLRGAASLV